MSICSYCGKKTDYSHKCKFCGDYFCSKHLLPENHYCSGLEIWKKRKHKKFRETTSNYFRKPRRMRTYTYQRQKHKFGIIPRLTFLIILVLFLYSIFLISTKESEFTLFKPLKCSDGTLYNHCSSNRSYYCFNGTLIKNVSRCGCPYDYAPDGNDCKKIQRCSDRTIYNECSKNKPLYCDDGELINKSSKCGCPYGRIIEGDYCVSKYKTGPKNMSYYYSWGTLEYTTYRGLNEYLQGLDRNIYYYDYETPPTDKDFILRDLNEPNQKEFLGLLVEKIRELKPEDKDQQAKIAIMLVQHIPYDMEAFESGDISGKYPYEVLYTKTGVCSEKAKLMAYLLRGLGYSVAILRFEYEDHDAIGIKCPSQYNYKNTGYCFVEPTELSRIGHSSGDYIGVGKLTSEPKVIVIFDGDALGSI